MAHHFPIYNTDDEARCWRCGGMLAGHEVWQHGSPLDTFTEGCWVQHCPACHASTRYDVRCDAARTDGTYCTALATTRRGDLPLCAECAAAMDEHAQES